VIAVTPQARRIRRRLAEIRDLQLPDAPPPPAVPGCWYCGWLSAAYPRTPVVRREWLRHRRESHGRRSLA
jgi:hypothetical protein